MQDQFHQDWLDAGFGAKLSFKDYVDLQMRYSRRQGNYNDDIIRKIGKINLSCFDGFGYTSAWAWVQKVDTYFQLNPLPEEEATKYVALHLEGIAHEQWHHGIVTLSHDQVTSYSNFMEKLIDYFDGKDLEINFDELA